MIWDGRSLALTGVLLGAVAAGPAGAQYDSPAPASDASPYDVLNVDIGVSVTHDSNLFRRPGLSGPPSSETIRTGYVGLRIDKPYAQQRFQLNVSGTAYRYNNFSNLNFDALDYRGAWLWHVSPRVSGTLSADRSKRLVSFEDSVNSQNNVRTSESRVFSLDGWVGGAWHLLLSASQSEQKSERALQPDADFRANTGEVGVKYLAQSGSSVTVARRTTEGDYLSRVLNPVTFDDTGYRQDDSDLRVSWILTASSAVAGRLTHLDRRHDNFPQRNFSGTAGSLDYSWTPTGRLRFTLTGKRDIVPWQDLVNNYRVNETFSLVPTWQVTSRITAHLLLARMDSNFPTSPFLASVPERNDTTRIGQLGMDWLPMRNVSVKASLQRQVRSSNDPSVEYGATVANIGAAFTF